MAPIQTRLYANPAELQVFIGSSMTSDCAAVVLFGLGFGPSAFVPFAANFGTKTPVFLADCYGILGFSAAENRNIELMEAGRGQEYGGVGGDGGAGVVAVAFSGTNVAASTTTLPGEGCAAHLVVAAHGSDCNALLARHASAAYYGGIAKATYRYAPDTGRFETVPYFFVSHLSSPGHGVGTTSFTTHVTDAVQALLDQAPAGSRAQAVALFPCFMRGKNEYGVNNVEADAVSTLLPNVPVFGMFCHGELGPKRLLGFAVDHHPQQSCGLHSMTTIVAVHTVQGP